VAVIAVEGLRKSYGPVRAVNNVSFEVAEGEIVALLGPNGAGKTTTVEILEGYRRRDAGRVSVLGMDPERGGRRLRERVGIVLQECGVEEFLTVHEVLRRHAGYYRAPRSLDDILALTGLTATAGARVQTLSGGQRRRLDLALALVGDPELIFLDEPTTGFDPVARRNAWATIKSLCGLGRTVLLTTHYMDEAQHLANRLVVIVGGRVVAEGTPESIGGRRTASVRVSFALPAALALADVPVPGRLENRHVVCDTADATGTLHALTTWAMARGVPLSALSVTSPSLEDVYLELIKR